MFKHYCLVAIRNIRKKPGFSLINFIGLSIGLSTALIVLLYVQFEWNFDKFHVDRDRIFRLKRFELSEDGMAQSFATPFLLKDVVEKQVPQIIKSSRLMQSSRSFRLPDQSKYRQSIAFVSPDFFDMFSFRLIEGKYSDDKYGIVLSKSAATRYFGKDHAVGRTVEMQLSDDFIPFTVTAVMEDTPSNSSIVVEAVVSDALVRDIQPAASLENWYNVNTDTYVMTAKPEDKTALTKGLESLMKLALGDQYQAGSYYFEPHALADLHFHTDPNPGSIRVINPKMLYVLLTLGLVVLVLGSINYVTMAIGKSVVRAKEVGVRKALGAQKRQLAFQFLFESMMITLLSFVLSVVLSLMLLPKFNVLFNTTLEIAFSLPQVMLIGLLLLFLTALAGGFPAFYMSGMDTVKVLKGRFSVSFGKQGLRKGLVGIQFFLSFLMISCTLVMYHQMEMVKSYDLGFSADKVYVVPIASETAGGFVKSLNTGFEKANIFRERLLSRTEVENAALSISLFGNDEWWNAGFKDKDGKQFFFKLNFVVGDYLGTMGIDIAEGRNFYNNIMLDSGAIMVNRLFASQMGWENPETAQLPGTTKFGQHEVVAFLEDFHHASLYEQIAPVMIAKNPKLILQGINDLVINGSNALVLVKTKQEDEEHFLEMLKAEYAAVYPGEEFTVNPFQDFVWEAYQNEDRLGQMVRYTAFVAVLIAIMGLLAFTAMTIAGRVKEIGIRKVLGASATGITWMFNKEFLLVTITGVLLAIPTGMWLMQEWLKQFAVREWPGLETVALTLIGGIFLTVLMVTAQSLSAALVNPVKTLKSE
jgi:putative ABC transport system permease protein